MSWRAAEEAELGLPPLLTSDYDGSRRRNSILAQSMGVSMYKLLFNEAYTMFRYIAEL